MNAPMFKRHVGLAASRRAQRMGLDLMFAQEENPFLWVCRVIEPAKKRNFCQDACNCIVHHKPPGYQGGNVKMEGYHPFYEQ
jgi:ribonucleotide reductase beta subunit family protein with ferritin-like domain